MQFVAGQSLVDMALVGDIVIAESVVDQLVGVV